MDIQQDEKPSEAGSKKGAYDEFSREDLVKKCKHLLMIAQKSKQTKTEIAAENAELKKQMEELQTQCTSGKKDLSTLQEIVESLTEQKLVFATELESHFKANNALKAQIELLNEKHEETAGALTSKGELLQKRISEMSGRLTNLEIENTSLKRQNARITDENESLFKQLEDLEGQIRHMNELAEAQRLELSKLEKIASLEQSDKKEDPIDVGHIKQEREEQIKTLENDLASASLKFDELSNVLQSKDEQLTSLNETLLLKEKLYAKEKEKKDNLFLKLKSYREKIVRCASSITQLKNCNLVLSKTVIEYSQSVPKWQNDILNASNLLSEQLLTLESENVKLKERLQAATESVTDSNQQTNEFEELNSKFVQLKHELRTTEEDRQSLNQRLKYLESSNDTFLSKVRELESDRITLESEEKHLRDIIESLKESLVLKEHELVRFSEDSYELKRIIERLENEKGSLNRDIEVLKADKSGEEIAVNLKKELTKAKDAYKFLENDFKSISDTNELLRDELNMLKISVEAPNQEVGGLSELNASLQADVSKLETKLSAYKQENSSLLSEVKDLGQKLASAEAILKDSEEQKLRYTNYKIENTELLNEMKEINQVLKERGETISKQEKAISESERVLQLLETEVKNLKEALTDTHEAKAIAESELDLFKRNTEQLKREKEEINKQISELTRGKESADAALDEKEDIITLLKDELERLKQNTSYNDVQSEVMSTSTISKLDESSRLKELDDSFEERYNKLKSFAVKLKKKVDALQANLQKAEEEKGLLEQSLEDAKKRLNVVTESKEVEMPVSEDRVNTNSIAGDKQIERLTLENENTLMKNGKLEEDMIKLVNEKVQLEMELAELKKWKNEAVVDRSKNNEVIRLKADLELRNAELSSQRDQLEKARKDMKKSSVLSLEMADYERSMKDQAIKIEESKRKIAQMESTIETHQATIVSLKTQVKLLEDQVKVEENQTREVKEHLGRSSAAIEERDNSIVTKNEQISRLERQAEELKSANEELSIHLASSLADKEKAVIALSNEKTELLQKMKKLETRYLELEEKCHLRSSEYDSLTAEFNGYKMRAQSVLRQNHVKDHSQEETLQNENISLKSEVDSLKAKVDTLKQECANLSSSLSVEKRRASENSQATARLRQLTDQLSTELLAARNELQEERAKFNLQVSTLTQCYKQQIIDLEARLQTETANLKKELSIVESRNVGKMGNRLHMASHSDGSDSLDTDINVAMLQREEGEGSESSPPPFIVSGPVAMLSGSADENVKTGRRSPLPLERLLEEGVPDDLTGGENDLRFVDMTPEQQLAETKKRLDIQEQRVQHVSLLLSESERESARLGEMCALLKAEVRRLTRALDRHTHAHNPEYLKNVLFKFLTLSAGDERVRLVPVLNTILTLSPEETHRLDAVAKGVDPNSNRGWGSYLPWPGPR